MTMLQAEIGTSNQTDEVFDVGNWLERATTKPAQPDYQPRHRADVPADSVA